MVRTSTADRITAAELVTYLHHFQAAGFKIINIIPHIDDQQPEETWRYTLHGVMDEDAENKPAA